MIDIYNFVETVFLPNLPLELYFLKPIFCIILFTAIVGVVLAPFIVLLMLIRR